jgi:muramoyltetrapeptide carboxypeptidase LdcA involved in peptidoglycan recycling
MAVPEMITARTLTMPNGEVRMGFVVPGPLNPADNPTIRVIAPSWSAGVVPAQVSAAATERLTGLGFRVTFGENAGRLGPMRSAPVAERVADLHAAFADPDVDLVLTAIGGHLSNTVLSHLDWDLIAARPKWLCGFSDITALQNALLARAGLVTLSGPHWSTFGCRHFLDSTVASFVSAVSTGDGATWRPESWWSDDEEWYLRQDDRTRLPSDGWWLLSPGAAGGRIVGGNLNTLALLQGTGLLPDLAGAVLFVEDNGESSAATVARRLHSLLRQPGADRVAGLVLGRFQRVTGVNRPLLEAVVADLPHLAGRPVIANADFGHTFPMYTFPIGGVAEIRADAADPGISWSLPV